METNDERIQRCIQQHESLLQKLIDEGELALSVRVTSKEQAEELVEWLYAPEKPMKSELLGISWNKSLVPKQQADLLEQMRESFLNS